MAIVTLAADGLEARLSTRGGTFTRLVWGDGRNRTSLLRESGDDAAAGEAAAFPLIPFGNRLRDNRFVHAGTEHRLPPNTLGDVHYLHGDAWLGEWAVEQADTSSACLSFRHVGRPYAYRALQRLTIRDGTLEIELSVENEGDDPLPFGLGWHPFFPRASSTTMSTSAARFWSEADGHLPGEPGPVPADLHFAAPRPLPDRWVNNGLEGWSGSARITWPEQQTALRLDADPCFRHAFLFVPDASFDPDCASDWFCLEPMTHLAGAHAMPDLGGLTVLGTGKRLRGALRLRPERLPPPSPTSQGPAS
ncbi:aldose 1-epimerase [Mangrovibrevibacter kandeliae]|uniref:aldose 1-epimerase n=1 Tax=Mangrovibrevibacter kandeliae TaxID=2968473 RepID=UPI002118A426|nr:aldose 1-epimerase [Aurantimonas sp. CSK15Z-1]MCQ8783069.1 aldose 1-epimerase [Aurantimonas sp. CSK15Z-1]